MTIIQQGETVEQAWAREAAEVNATLDALGISDHYGLLAIDDDPIELAAEGFTLTIEVGWDDEPYEPGDCHDPKRYEVCNMGACGCYPAEVVYVIATVLDPAGAERGCDSLYGIGTDDAMRDPYVRQIVAECAAEACRLAGVAPNAAV